MGWFDWSREWEGWMKWQWWGLLGFVIIGDVVVIISVLFIGGGIVIIILIGIVLIK